jgi:hypothetical protein
VPPSWTSSAHQATAQFLTRVNAVTEIGHDLIGSTTATFGCP